MDWPLFPLLFLILLLQSCQSSELDVIAGQDVVLRCRFPSSSLSDRNTTLYWIVENMLGSDNAAIGNKPWDSDYELIYEPAQGVYDLHIRRAKYRRDNGKFKCIVKEDRSRREVHSQSIDLTVLLKPSEPIITPKQQVVVTEGQLTNLTCSSRNGSPSPTVKWLDEQMHEVNFSLTKGTNKDEATKSVLMVRPTKDMDNAVFKCSVWNRAMKEQRPLIAQTSIRVNYFPRVRVGPSSSLSLELGTSATLSCDVDARPAVQSLNWQHDGNLISSKSSLNLRSVQKKDAGTYRCEADNNLGQVGSGEVVVDVQYGPKIRLEEMLEIDEMEEVRIECVIDANPAVHSVVWLKEGDSGFKQNGNVLNIRRIRAKQAGIYTCLAKNTLTPFDEKPFERTGNASVTINVRHKPGKAFVIVEEKNDNNVVSVVAGERAEIRCAADPPGYPLPKFTFWKDSDTLNTRNDLKNVFTLDPVRMSSGGRYWCQPHNDLGQGLASFFELDVHQAPKLITQLQPTIIKRAGNSGFQVTCSARGKPKPNIKWFKDDMELESGQDLFEILTSEKMRGDSGIFTVQSTLKFRGEERIANNQLMANDRGHYSCKFANKVASISTSMTLRIEHAPIVVHRHNKVAADIGSGALITCLMQAYPVPRFDWSLGKSVLQMNQGDLVSNTSTIEEDIFESALKIKSVSQSDYGDYTCRAVNNMGAKRTIIRLQPKGKPEQPTHLRPLDSSSSSIMLGFDENFNGGYNDTKFVVQYQRNNDADVPLYKECLKTTCNLTQLEPNSFYVVRVKASNIRGESKYSRKLVVATKIDLNRIPKPDNVIFATKTKKLHLKLEQEQSLPLVARIEIENDDGSWVHHNDYSVDIKETEFNIGNDNKSAIIPNDLRVKLCVQSNQALCGPYVIAERVEQHVEHQSISFIVVIVVIIAVILSTIIIGCLLCKCCNKKGNKKDKTKNDNNNKRPSIVHPSIPSYGIENKGVDTLKDMNNQDATNNLLYKNNIYSVQNTAYDYNNGHSNGTNGAVVNNNSNSGTTGGSVNSQDSLWRVNNMLGGNLEQELEMHQQQLIMAGKSPIVVHELPNYPYPEEYLGNEQGQQLLNPNDPFFHQHHQLLIRHSQLQQQQQQQYDEYGQHDYGNAMMGNYALGDPYVHGGYNASPATAVPTSTSEEGDEAVNRRKIIREIIV